MRVCVCVCLGGGPVLGHGPRGVGQSRSAETPDEAPGGMSKDVSGTMFCCKYYTQVIVRNKVDFKSLNIITAQIAVSRKSVKSESVFPRHPSLSHCMALIYSIKARLFP